MHSAEGESLLIEPAREAEWPEALSLALAGLPPGEREARVSESMRQAPIDDSGALGVWVARRGERLVGAVHMAQQPGRTAIVVAPRVVPGEPRDTAVALMQAACSELQSRGTCMAQALEAQHDAADAHVFEVSGFRHVADLLYLVSPPDSFPSSRPLDELEFLADSANSHDRLGGVIERTYEGSLDCPAIDKIRSIDDVLAGYRAVGAFDPAHWLIVRHGDADVGCLLLAVHPQNHHWELVYMGVVPEARGRGWGLSIVRYAQWLARAGGAARLALAVDAANAPAIRVYAAAGFTTWERRRVYVCVF